MKDISALIQAVSTLLWPVFAFWALFIFKDQIKDIVPRIRKGKVLGQEIELADSLAALQSSATIFAAQVAQLPTATREDNAEEMQATDQEISQILKEAATSPKIALIALSAEIERELRMALASTGRYTPKVDVLDGVRKLGLPSALISSVDQFRLVRNRLVHGYEVSQDAVVSALDSGITILQAIKSLPRETNTVFHAGVELFRDAAATDSVPGVTGLLLERTSSEGEVSYTIYPTTKANYLVGKAVSWEWNMSRTFGEMWYRDPESGGVRGAWRSSAEFIGRHLDEL